MSLEPGFAKIAFRSAAMLAVLVVPATLFDPARADVPAVCGPVAATWDAAVRSGNAARIASARRSSEGMRGACPDLLKRIDGYRAPEPAQGNPPVARRQQRQHVTTVAEVENGYLSPPVELFPGETIRDLDEVSTRTAAFLKSTGFRRNPTILSNDVGYAIFGIDVVYAFEQGKVDEADSENSIGYVSYVVSWNGALWRFRTQENLRRFLSDPEKYFPAYGGHCAYCIAEDDVTGGYSAYVYKDRLYLFVGDMWRDRWLENIDYYIDKADRRWPTLPVSRMTPLNNNDFFNEVKSKLDRL